MASGGSEKRRADARLHRTFGNVANRMLTLCRWAVFHIDQQGRMSSSAERIAQRFGQPH